MRYKGSILTILCLVFSSGLFLVQSSHAEGVTKTIIMANACTTCHGPDGKGAKKIPKLKGLEISDIVESMKGFQSGEEKATIMNRHAQTYTDDEIDQLAKYFAAL